MHVCHQLSDPSAMNSAAGAALYTTQLMRDADKDDFQRYLCLDDVGHWLCAIVEWPAVKGKPQVCVCVGCGIRLGYLRTSRH